MKDSVIIKRIWQHAKPYKWAFLISYLVLLVELVFNQIIPLFLEDVINFAVYEADMQGFLNAKKQAGGGGKHDQNHGQ